MTSTRDEWVHRFLQVTQINALFRAFKRLCIYAQHRRAVRIILNHVRFLKMRDYDII